MAALETDPQVEPRVADGQAVCATIDRLGEPGDLYVGTVPAGDHHSAGWHGGGTVRIA